MSEYQHYEFLAVDHRLDKAAQAKLRRISSRAQISTTSFVNHYNWGDLGADPVKLLERYFDLFLYEANWGTRRFALRVPRDTIDLSPLDAYDPEEFLQVKKSGSNLIIDITRQEVDYDEDYPDEGLRLAAFAPLRAALIGGDPGLISVFWLMLVDMGLAEDDVAEPVPVSGRASAALTELAEFLAIDRDLITAAFGANVSEPQPEPTEDEIHALIRSLPEEQKTFLLLRLHSGEDPHLGATFRRQCRAALDADRDVKVPGPGLRTAGALRAEADRIAATRERRAEERAAAQRRRAEQKEAEARALRVAALAGREVTAWRELEGMIMMRNPKGYDQAMTLLGDLGALAGDGGKDAFMRRVADIATRHERKGQFVARLAAAGLIAR